MGALGIIGKIIAFPFKLIFGEGKKKEHPKEEMTNLPALQPSQPSPTDITSDTLKARVDLMLAQIDNLKVEYETINQRIQNIERMVRELYIMAKS